MFCCLKINIQMALCAAFAVVFLLNCAQDYNPWDNYSNAQTGLLPEACSKKIRDGDTLDIFTTETLAVYTSVREKIDSVLIHADRNRYWSDTTFIPPLKDSLVLLLSFWDTGNVAIKITTCRSNQTVSTLSPPLSFYVRSPLKQKDIDTVFGQPYTLSAVPLGDMSTIIYVWQFGANDTVTSLISDTTSIPYSKLAHVEIGKTGVGFLYVKDLKKNFISPSITFNYLFWEPAPPGIKCINPGLSGDTVITGDTTLVFKFQIIDPSAQGLANVNLSGKQPHMSDDGTYFENIPGMDQYTPENPKKEIITATNYLSQTTIDTFFLYFEASGPHNNDMVAFKLIYPPNPTLNTTLDSLYYSINISNFSQDTAYVSTTVTNSKGRRIDLPSNVFSASNDTFQWTVPLDTGYNAIQTLVSISKRYFSAETTIVVQRAMHSPDTTRPVITAIYVNDSAYLLTWDSTKVLSVDSPNVIVKISAIDYESGIDSVTITETPNIAPAIAMTKETNIDWLSAPIPFPSADTIITLKITVKSKSPASTNTTTRTIKVSNIVSVASIAPSITTQPKSQTIMAGQAVTFSVTTTGTAPLSYQWYKDGATISGATSAGYTLSNVQTSDSGTYIVTVSNGTLPNATSSGALLTVSAVPVAPSITIQPKSDTVTAGQNVTFSVMATGTTPLSYQWYKNGTVISGATSSSYILTNIQAASAGMYTVIVSNGTLPNAMSSGAVLTVSPLPIAPSITTQPKSKTITAGQNDTFSVTATGTGTLSYQWYKNGTAISGATSSSYTLTNVQAASAGTYTVTVSNGTLPNATSSGAVLTVNVPPSITVQPKSAILTAGQNDTLSVMATGTGTLSYQWYKNGSAISGATSSRYTLTNIQTASAGTYTVIVSNETLPNATSSGAVLTVSPLPIAPSITMQPKSATLTAGQNDTLSVTATGTGTLSYQWYKNGTAISGATSSSYTLTNVQAASAGTYTVIVSNGTLPNATSSGAVLTVNVPPSIIVQPKSAILTAGQNDTLSVTATGTGTLSYQWYKNGSAISGATSSRYTLTNVQAASAGTYTVTVSNGTLPNATSSGAVLAVNVPPTITTQPKSDTVTAGQNVTFSVTATGTGTLSYQWYKNGSAISGATSSSYTLTNVQTAGAGTYTVTVFNGTLPNATSSGAVLTVNPAPVAPSITVQPKAQTVTAGQNVTFSVTATGTSPLLYQWYKNGIPILGATLSSYTLTNVQAANAGTYTVMVSDGTLPNATSSGAMLTVNVPPTITTQPKSDTVTAGQNDTFSVTATGTAPLSYQWYKNGSAISGATSSSYTLTNIQAASAGTFTVTVSNVTLQNATSNPAVLTVNPAPVAPSINAQPQPQQTVTAGGSATFSVTATGTPTPSYQWFKNDTAIASATSSSYQILSVKTSDAGAYKVTVSNGILPNATSSNALLTVNPAPVAPSISAQPQPQTVTAGQSVTFSVTATGTPTPSYQWFKNDTAIASATSSSYSITSVQTTDAGTYKVTVSNGVLPNATSTGASLTVNPAPAAPSISMQPQPQTVTAGQSVTFNVTASGTPTPSYQWFKNDTAIASATSSSYSITSVQTTDAGTYKVTVSNGVLPNATSTSASLTVNPAPIAPSISAQPQPQTVAAGGSVTFSVTASGTPTPSYQWYKGVTPVGDNSPNFSIVSVQATDAGTYSVMVSNGTLPDAVSDGALLTVTQ
jgi:hypothetical protein